jgi:dynein light chain roadblock-type
LKRIVDHPGVSGLIIMQEKRQPVFTTMDNNKTFLFANRLCDFVEIAEHTIKSVYPEDELMVIRIKTNKYEIMQMLPTKNQSIVVIQQSNNST